MISFSKNKFTIFIIVFVFTALLMIPTIGDVYAEKTTSVITEWGTKGSGDGQFEYPMFITLDSLDNVYVTDRQNNRIQKFDSNGNFILKWGTKGSGDGQWDYTTNAMSGIAVDSLNNVYVASQKKIQKFDSNGNFILKWGSQGTGDGQFNVVSDIVVDSSNNLYITDWHNNRIQKFDSNGNFILKWGIDSSKGEPFGMAIDSSNNLYVSQPVNGGQVQKFDSNGNFLLKIPGNTGSSIYDVDIDSSDNLYVVSYAAPMKIFNSGGTFLHDLKKSDGSDFSDVRIAIDSSGNIFVYENNHIQKLKILEAPPPEPDMIITDIKITQIPLTRGDYPNVMKITISYTWKNQGFSMSDDHSNFIKLLDTTGKPIQLFSANGDYGPNKEAISNQGKVLPGTGEIESNANGSIYATVTKDWIPGEYTVRVESDATKMIKESNEGNNILEKKFKILDVSSQAVAPFTILDDSTGGDCKHIGNWDGSSKTCTLTRNINATSSNGIIIASNGITLQGRVEIIGPHLINPLYRNTSTDYSFTGVLVDGKSNITLKDFNLQNFKYGIMAKNIDTLTIKDVTSNDKGLYVVDYLIDNSDNVILDGAWSNPNQRCHGQNYGCPSALFIINSDNVVVKDNGSGLTRFGVIKIGNSHNVELSHVRVEGGHPNYGYGVVSIAQRSSNINIHDSTFITINTSGFSTGVPNSSSSDLAGSMQDGGCSASDVPRICTAVGEIGNGITIKNNKIFSRIDIISISDAPLTITGNTFTDLYNRNCGIHITAGTTNNNLWGYGKHVITDNSFSCPSYSIYILGNNENSISRNTFQNGDTGIELSGSKNNKIFENNFINTKNPIKPLNTINVSPLPQPPTQSTGNNVYNNFWTYFDSASEQCYNDSPFDKFCDSSFSLTPKIYSPSQCQGYCSSIHTLTLPFLTPWVLQNGAMPSSPIPSPPDTTKPILTVPSTQTYQSLDQSGLLVNYGIVTASDDRKLASEPTCDINNNSVFPVGTTKVTCKATDQAGNVAEASFSVIVNFSEKDTTLPIITVPQGITMQTTNTAGAIVNYSNATATDNDAVVWGPTCTPSSGSLFPLGNNTITCQARDKAGNTAVSQFWANIVYTFVDNIPPVLIVPENISLNITNSTGARVYFETPTATDNVKVTQEPTCSHSSFSLFPVGVTSVICTAADAAGNTGTNSFTITVINTNVVGDNIPPTFTKMQDISLVAITSNGATVTYDLPKVTDNIKVTSGPICTPASGSFFPIGQTIVTCTASDAAKNQGSTTFTVTVSSLIAVPVEIPSSVSVSTGKLYYSSTEAVFVTGIATPQTDNEVSITVRDSLDNLVLSEYLPVKISGVYTGIIFPNSLWNTNGTYLMSANYGTSTTNTAFEFEFVPTEINNSNIPTGITLSLDSTQRILGDKLEITSTLTGGASGQSILIDVTNPLGNSVLLQSLNTNEVGSVTLSVNIQDDWISGVYTITASDTSPLLDYSTSKSLQIVAPLPEIIISPTLSTTESGQTITSYDAGDIGYFSTSLLSESTSNVLVTVNVVDSEDTTLGVAFFKSVIGKGDSKIVLGFKIPEDAADGEAKIYVNTYTNWIDQGGIPISSELISTVNIKGIVVKVVEESIIDESYDAIISPANGSGTPGCEKTQEGCFIPNQTTVNLGDVVLFSNTDIVSHTFTAGSASDGPTGEFDSGLVISGDSYKWTANVAGEIDYFCMIHPWMTGLLIVQDNSVKPIILPENIIPTLSVVSNLVLSASNSTGTIVNYDTPTATGGEITTGVTCTPPSGSLFPIGSTQVTCTATNKVGNTGMTSFMVTINPVPKVSDQTLSVKVGKVSYNNLEPIFVTGSIGKITGQPIILEVYDEANNLISIKQVTPKESKTYTTVLTSNELWNSSGQYNIIATYGTVTAQNTFDFEVMGIQEVISEKIPKSLFVDTDKSTYVLGDDVLIEMQLVDGGSGQSILLEVRDSQNYPVLLQSLNTDNNGTANILYQSDSAHHSGIYSIITKSQTSDWEFTSTKTFVTVPQIPDITIGNTVSTLSDGNKVEYFGTGTMGYFHTPVVSKSVSDVLITVNIFDVQNTPLGLAYFDSKVVDDTFDIVLGLQIPQDAAPGLATVYINTYTEWPNEGGVPILAERVSFIEIKPSNQSNLILSNNSTSNNSTSTNSTEK